MAPHFRRLSVVALLSALLLTTASTTISLEPKYADLAFGSHAKQKLDVYAPANANGAPIILYVHGGAWRSGDKANPALTALKVPHYVSQGYIFVSANYRNEEGVSVKEQVADVAGAIGYVQKHAGEWGGDASQLAVVGFSAGAHLVEVVGANPAAHKLKPWRATVGLDNIIYDVVDVLSKERNAMYDVFGTDKKEWAAVSPKAQLSAGAPPMLIVCSNARIMSCIEAKSFVKDVKKAGAHATLLAVDYDHLPIDRELGGDNAYTLAVDEFIAGRLNP